MSSIANSAWLLAVLVLTFNFSRFYIVSADQCTKNYNFHRCLNIPDSDKQPIFVKRISEFPTYDHIECGCATEVNKLRPLSPGIRYFAMKVEEPNIECFSVSLNYNGIWDMLENEMQSKINQIMHHCTDVCDSEGGCFTLGTGDYTAIYNVSSRIVTIPPETTTTIKTDTVPPPKTTPNFWIPTPTERDWWN